MNCATSSQNSGQAAAHQASILLFMDDAAALKPPPPMADSCEERCEIRTAEPRAVDLDALVALHGRRVARLVARLVDRREDVEDLVQETFLAAWNARARFRGECGEATWLARIAVNKCRSHRRWLGVRRFVRFAPSHEDDDSARREADRSPGETEEEIRLAVARLPAKYREPIVLRYFEDLSIDEMSQVLGLSRAAVDKRLSRARQQLKEVLKGRL